MNDMRLIMEQWDSFLTNEQQSNGWVTWRMFEEVVDLIKAEQEGRDVEARKKKLLSVGGKSLLKLAVSLTGPLAPLISAGVDSIDILKDMVGAYAQADDGTTKQNPFLDLFNIDDGYQDLIDDKLEDDFVEKMLADIPNHVSQHPDQVIPDFDQVIQAWLPTLNLSGTTNNNVTKTKTTEQ